MYGSRLRGTRHKQRKPRRPQGESGQPATEWFGTAFHSIEGMQHLDVRHSGNSILITSSPAEIDGVPASWPLRLRNDGGSGLNEVGAALAAGRGHVVGVTEGPGHKTVLAFMPDHPEEGVGTLARVRTPEAPDGESSSMERGTTDGAEAGESLLRILPLLGPDAPPADELEDCRLCPGCYRPVYESSSSHTLVGLDTRQRTVLETVAAALA
ncbi:hypothetical protein OG795_00055 [[Kitasatospora] papulosa]|uniref:hypothetical protein n=1 Tax=[Kitasatospora] papulosa TaxID=1464011 RepID=UPI003244E73A